MDGVKDASREELLRLLALERERRFTAERTAEEEKQAALQLLLLFQEKAEPLSLQPELTRSHSISSSIISSPIPRAFSQDFYEAVLHELPVDLQDTLAGLQQGNSSGKAPESSSSFAKACFAIEQGNYSQLSLILREDNVNGGGSLEGSEGGKALLVQYGTQLLHLAVEKYTADCVTVLLDKGVSPNESGLSSLPPLHMAAKNGGKKCIKILLHYGAEVNLQDTKGHTPLYLALEAGHGECAQLLLNAKPNLSILTMGRSSLLHAAVSGCKEFELRLILVQIHSSLQPGAISALVNGQESKEGYTPLHLAASKGYLGCIMILLSDPQVNPDLLTFSGETAFGLSSSTDCQLLLSTKKHKEANVVVLAGKGVSSPPRSVIGCVKVLSHHSWSDLEYLVKGALDEFAYVQNYDDDDVNDKFMESSAYLKQKHLTVKEEDSVTQLIQVESRKLTDEMKKVITKRQNSLSPPERLSGSIKDIHIGKYNKERSDKQDRKGRSPYEVLAELEESGELLEVTVSLQNSYEHISFISLIPSGVLKKYTNQLLNNKCVVIHGPPETDLNQLPGLLLSCLRTATTGEIEKIHLNLSPSFTVAYLVSLLYDNGLLQPCGEGKEQEEPATELPISSLLVMEGIDRLKDFDVLSVLYSLLDDHYAAGEGVWLDTNDQSSISPGKYILSHQCYVIGTRTLFASSGSSLPGDIMDSYAHIWLSDGDEPSLGYLLRYYTRELVSTNKGKLPVKSDYTYQAVVWVWQFWLLYNYYMQQFGYFHLTIGVKLFLNCPVMNADSIYNWFAELWSFHIIPKLKENLLHQETQPQQTKNQKKTDAIYKNLVFFLVHRIVSSTCPLPPEAIHDFLTALYSFNDIMYLSPGQAATDLINKSVGKDLLNGKDTRSPRTKRASKKSSTTDNGKSDEWTVSVADAVRKYQSSIEGLSASTGDLTKIKRPKSGSFFSKNSTLRRSLFRGSKASLYAVEEEDGGGGGGSSKLKRKKKKEQKDQKEDEESKGEKMEELFDVLMQADERMDDQRVQPPHHVISVVSSSPQATPTTSHSSSHSLTDNLDVIRPLSADRSPSFTPSSDLSLNKLRKTQHPRISNLLEVHSLPHALSRSDENVYHTSTVSSNSSSLVLNNSPHPFSASTAPYHPRQISTASSDAAFSDSRRSSTDSMTNSCISGTTSRAQSELIRSGGSEFTRASSVEGMVNHQRGCSAVTDNDGSSLSAAEGLTSTDTSFIDQNSYSVHVTSTPVTVDSNPNSKQSSVDISNDAPAAADSNPLVASPRTRKLSRSYQALYSASLGFCDTDSLRATQSRKISLPAKIEGPPSPSRRGLKRMMSSSLLDWTLQESVVEM